MQISTPEQESKALQQAQRDLHEALERHKKALDQLRGWRARYAQVNHGLSDPATEAGKENQRALAELRGRIQTALEERDAARAAVDAAKDSGRKANIDACRELVDAHSAEYRKHLRSFVLARLERLAPEIVSAWHCRDMREALTVSLGIQRAARINRLGPALDLVPSLERFEDLRRLAVEAIEHQVIKPADVPKELRSAWNL